jgi:hypothetical protein
MRSPDNSPPSATSRPYLGHAVGEHAVPSPYTLPALYRGPAARRSNHDHDRVPYIWARCDHSHMRRLVGSEARLRGEVPPEIVRFCVQEPPTVGQTFGNCAVASSYVKLTATEIGEPSQEPIAIAGGQGVNSVPQPLYGSTTRSDIKGLC